MIISCASERQANGCSAVVLSERHICDVEETITIMCMSVQRITNELKKNCYYYHNDGESNRSVHFISIFWMFWWDPHRLRELPSYNYHTHMTRSDKEERFAYVDVFIIFAYENPIVKVVYFQVLSANSIDGHRSDTNFKWISPSLSLAMMAIKFYLQFIVFLAVSLQELWLPI